MKSFYSFIPFIIFLFISSCQVKEESKDTQNKPLVLTTFTILADISRNIAGERLIVQSITKQGAEIHGYSPTPSDLLNASNADLIVENGLGLELWAKKYIAAAGDVPTVVLSEGLQPLLIKEDRYLGKPNPHVWMSPKRAIHYVNRLVEAFIELDPIGEPYFLRKAEIYKNKLAKLDQELQTAMDSIPPKKKVLVSCEGAFTYLANDYGMEEAYLWPVNAESQVTPRRMLNLIQLIKDRKIPTIFCESTVSSKAQREVARISGADFGGTFYVDSLSSLDGPAPTFLALQRHNIKLILKGLSSN